MRQIVQDALSAEASERASEEGCRPVMLEAMKQLPTLQRNALCKIFDRHEFSPEEVAALGYRRLQQAEGIGTKGLAAIVAWLELHGFELKPPVLPEVSGSGQVRKQRKGIEYAVRLLRMHGYEVVPGKRESQANGKHR